MQYYVDTKFFIAFIITTNVLRNISVTNHYAVEEFWDIVYIKIYVYEIPIFRWLRPIICKIRSMQLHICVPWVKSVWEIEVWG